MKDTMEQNISKKDTWFHKNKFVYHRFYLHLFWEKFSKEIKIHYKESR